MADYRTFAFFTVEGTGKAGLAVTVDVYRFTTSGTKAVTSASATALGDGLYTYVRSDTIEGDYIAIFKTADTTVDSKQIVSMMSREQAKINIIATVIDAIKTGVDNLVARLTESRANLLDKLNIGTNNTIAHTGNAASFKADVTGLETANNAAARELAIKQAITDKAVTPAVDISELETKTLAAGRETAIKQAITDKAVTPAVDISNLPTTTALTQLINTVIQAITDKPVTPATDISALTTLVQNVQTVVNAIDISNVPTNTQMGVLVQNILDAIEAKPVTPAPNLSGLETQEKASQRETAIKQAITDKPVTPAVDISTLATQTGVATLVASIITSINEKPVTPPVDISELVTKTGITELVQTVLNAIASKPVTPAVDISELVTKEGVAELVELVIQTINNKPVTEIPAIVFEQMEAIKDKTDQLIFVNGSVNANTTIDMSTIDVARQSSLNELVAYLKSKNIFEQITNEDINMLRGNDWTIMIPCELPVGENVNYQFAAKNPLNSKDSKSAIFIDNTGLVYLNGKKTNNAALGHIYYDGFAFTARLEASATSQLIPGTYWWGVQTILETGEILEDYQGKIIVHTDIVRAT